jgi:hypothetical protein
MLFTQTANFRGDRKKRISGPAGCAFHDHTSMVHYLTVCAKVMTGRANLNLDTNS